MDSRSISSADRSFSNNSSLFSSGRYKPARRITSKANIGMNLMPGFMQITNIRDHQPFSSRQQREESPDERTPSPIHRHSDSFTSAQRSINRSNTYGKRLNFSGLQDDCDEFIQFIKSEENKEKLILKVGNIDLSVHDMQSLLDNSPIRRSVIDACLNRK